MRVVPLEPGEPDTPDPVLRQAVGLRAVDAPQPRPGRDVVEDVLPREDRIDLEHVADRPTDAGHRLAVEKHLALARRLEPRDQRQRRRFPAAGRADDRAELANVNAQIQVPQRGVRRAGRREKAFRDAAQLDRRRALLGEPAREGLRFSETSRGPTLGLAGVHAAGLVALGVFDEVVLRFEQDLALLFLAERELAFQPLEVVPQDLRRRRHVASPITPRTPRENRFQSARAASSRSRPSLVISYSRLCRPA